MEQIVSYECGFLDAMRLLKAGEYISPFVTLDRTTYIIKDHELEAYYKGCAEAVWEYTERPKFDKTLSQMGEAIRNGEL
jgi:hypothetical protein